MAMLIYLLLLIYINNDLLQYYFIFSRIFYIALMSLLMLNLLNNLLFLYIIYAFLNVTLNNKIYIYQNYQLHPYIYYNQ